MNINSPKLTPYAPVVLRLTLTGVYMWFGVSQLTNPSMWVSLVPPWASGILDASTIVHLNGGFEVIAAALLLFGIYTRPVAFLLFLHLLPIAASFGPGSAIGIRDFGLSFSTLALALFGQDAWSLYPNSNASSHQ